MSLASITRGLITEIFPNRIRAPAVFRFGCHCVGRFLRSHIYFSSSRPVPRLGTSGTFFIYAAICFAGAVFVSIAVRETKGRSLETPEQTLIG
jgi:MFS transporter, SP family, xylose:H+ symportor